MTLEKYETESKTKPRGYKQITNAVIKPVQLLDLLSLLRPPSYLKNSSDKERNNHSGSNTVFPVNLFPQVTWIPNSFTTTFLRCRYSILWAARTQWPANRQQLLGIQKRGAGKGLCMGFLVWRSLGRKHHSISYFHCLIVYSHSMYRRTPVWMSFLGIWRWWLGVDSMDLPRLNHAWPVWWHSSKKW